MMSDLVEKHINVVAEQTPTGLVARIIGEAGVNQVDELDRQLHLLTTLSPKLVVLDLSAMPYISSMGIGSLLRFRNEVAQGGGAVVVAAPSKQVGEAFRLANIDRVLPVHPTIDAALGK
jgi:anti-sigma B factor antagonist